MPKPSIPTWLLAGALVLVTIAVYWPTMGHDFVSFDDYMYVTDNTHVTSGLTLGNARWAFQSGYAANWHPITWLSHMLDCQLFGLKPGGHHLTSVLLHALNAGLVFALLQRMTGAAWPSFLVAALFALHPLRVESVVWVAERKDVLSGCFGLLSLLAYARYARGTSEVRSPKSEGDRRSESTARAAGPSSALDVGCSMFDVRTSVAARRFWYWSAVAFFALGLMSKSMLVTLPFVLLLLDYWPLGRMKRSAVRDQRSEAGDTLHAQRSAFHASRITFHVSRPTAQSQIANRKSQICLPLLVEKLPFFVLAGAASVVTFLVQRRGGAMTVAEYLPLGVRSGNALISYGRYLGKLFWPVNLVPYYPHPGHLPMGQVVLAVLVLGGLSALVLWLGWVRTRSTASHSFEVKSGTRWNASLPPKETGSDVGWLIVGWLWFLGMLVPVIGLVQVGQQGMADRYTYLPSLGVLLVAVWGAYELAQGKAEGRGQRSAAGDTLHAPRSMLHASRFTFHVSRTRVQSQIANRKSQILLWVAGCATITLCFVLTRQQLAHWKDSETLFRHMVAVNESDALAHNNLGIALGRKGQLDEAIRHCREAIRLQPEYAEAHNNLGIALDEKGQVGEAIIQYREAIRLKPDYADAYYNLGTLLLLNGHLDEAIHQFQEALRLNPNHAEARDYLQQALARKSNPGRPINP
jgi:protein O-mannosyl-transferase